MDYFFSDAHLGIGGDQERLVREGHVVRFLDHVGTEGADRLWIVGDLFDYWFDYRTVIPRDFVRTLGALTRLADSGVQIEYVIGNHDFGHFRFFRDEVGANLHGGDVERELYGQRVCISHGDGKALNDTPYLIMKKVLRSRAANALWRWLHPDIGIGIASSISRRSRLHTTKKYSGVRPGEADGLALFAREKLQEGFDVVVMGHNHAPQRIEQSDGVYVNLGNWMGEERTFMTLDEAGPELRVFR